MPETNRIEYKRELNDKVELEKEVVAFLNYKEGGSIYFGIDKLCETVGVSNMDEDMLTIKNRIKDNILPSAMGLFDVIEERRDGLDIIRVIVASGSEKPYYHKKYGMTPKGCFIRIGTASEPMTQSMIDSLFSKRTRNSIGKIRSNRQDLTFEQLHIYYQERQKSLNSNFTKTLELVTPDGDLNYVAYLLSDENNISIKIAKYSSLDRTELEENNEYGYCSLIKATKSVYEKLKIENRVASTITPNDRIDTLLWNEIALREAVRNAIVHNDYSTEVPPKFEIFPNRIEITSSGALPENLSRSEFFEGISVPRNKELMRVFGDLGMVESLGSGVPRIIKAYGEGCYQFMENYTRIIFPSVGDSNQDSNQVSNQDSNQDGWFARDALAKAVWVNVTEKQQKRFKDLKDDRRRLFDILKEELSDESFEILSFCSSRPYSKADIFEHIGLTNQSKNSKMYLQPLIDKDLISSTIKDRPQSKHQKYILTNTGKLFVYYIDYLELLKAKQ